MKKIFLLVLCTFTPFLQAMERVQQLKQSALRRSSSEGTGPDGFIKRPSKLSINTASPKINGGPLTAHARIEDSTQDKKTWQALQILNVNNNLPVFSYNNKLNFFVTSPIKSPLSHEEDERFGRRLFHQEIDRHLENNGLVLNFFVKNDDSAVSWSHVYLPGAVKENNKETFGIFEYRFFPDRSAEFAPPRSDGTLQNRQLCNYREFHQIQPDQFMLDTIILELDETPLTAPNKRNKEHVEKAFADLKLIETLLESEQEKDAQNKQDAFAECFFKNMRTLLAGQVTMLITTDPELDTKLRSYRKEINNSKNLILGAKETLDNATSKKITPTKEAETLQEMHDQVCIINQHRQLQVAALLEAWEQQSA